MKWIKLILSIVVGVAVFFVLFNKLNPFDLMEYSGWMSDVSTPSIDEALDKAPFVPFFKQLLFYVYMLVIMFISTSIAVAITEKYRRLAAIIVGIMSGLSVILFVGVMLLNMSGTEIFAPIIGGVIGWLSSKYSSGIIEKIKETGKALTAEFDD